MYVIQLQLILGTYPVNTELLIPNSVEGDEDQNNRDSS